MLFGNTKIIIYLGRERVVVGDYNQVKPDFFEVKYKNNLKEVFDTIIEKLPSNSYKIILSKEISYTVKWDKTIDILERLQIKEELIKYIPENFEDEQFDWKLDKEGKYIEAIVITKDTYKALQEIRAKHPELRLETQSVTSLFWELNKKDLGYELDPEIFQYAANKGKERGGDEMVLNVEINPTTAELTPKSNKPRNNKTALLLLGLVFIIIGLGTWIIRSRIQSKSSIPLSTTLPSPTPIPSPVVIIQKNPTDYKILVRNGTLKTGFAASTTSKLLAADFTGATVDTLKESSKTTKIYTREALPDEIQSSIINILLPLQAEIIVGEIDTIPIGSDIVISLGEK